MSKLDAELLEAMKRELLARKTSLTNSVHKELDTMSNDEGRHLADLADAGGDANDEDRSFRLLEISGAELEQVDAALDKINLGTYGICEDCEKPIKLERLQALPFAIKCIACKREEESSESEGLRY